MIDFNLYIAVAKIDIVEQTLKRTVHVRVKTFLVYFLDSNSDFLDSFRYIAAPIFF